MSNNFLKACFTIIVGGLVGYYSVKNLAPHEESQNRFLASVPISKMGAEQMSRNLFDVKLNLDSLAQKDSDTSTLLIQVIALKKVETGLQYTWILPQGVNLVNGSLSDSLGEITPGNSKEISIQVTGFSKEMKKYISFEVAGKQSQIPVRREVLVSSRIEDSLEYMVQQDAMKKQNDGNTNDKATVKKSKFSVENVVR
ncbi:MAG: hypothetical protein ACXVAX_06535 [Pseudobdellovibrio sp.]